MTDAMGRTDERAAPLRIVLHVNVVFTTAAAAAMVAAPGPIDTLLGTSQETVIRAVGVGLAVFAGLVAAVARTTDERLLRGAPMIATADASWVVGSVIAVFLGWFDAAGVLAVLGCAAAVGAFAAAELVTWRAATTHPERIGAGTG